MFILRFLWAVLTSRWLWTLIGLALLVADRSGSSARSCSVGAAAPFASEIVRLGMIVGLVLLWLIWLILAQRRAIRANRLFVAEIAAPGGQAARPPATRASPRSAPSSRRSWPS